MKLTEAEYMDTVKLRLLCPVFTLTPTTTLQCPCNKMIEHDGAFGYHALNCPRIAGYHRRHKHVKEATMRFLRRLEYDPIDEPPLAGGRADIRYGSGDAKYIDVSVVSPASNKYAPTGEDVFTSGYAAAKMARNKIQHYVVPGGIPEDNFVPFIMEATGAIGERGIQWLESLTLLGGQADDGEARKRKYFLNELAVAVARGNSRMLRQFLETAKVVAKPVSVPVADPPQEDVLTQDPPAEPAPVPATTSSEVVEI